MGAIYLHVKCKNKLHTIISLFLQVQIVVKVFNLSFFFYLFYLRGQSVLQIWGGATCFLVNFNLTAVTERDTHLFFRYSTLVTADRAERVFFGCCNVVCFCLVLPFLSFPLISGRCSLLPSVMGILSKMLFNFRKTADVLCELSSSSREEKKKTQSTLV